MKGVVLASAILAIVVLGGVFGYHEWKPRPPPTPKHIVDRLCDFVTSQNMNCVAVLADDTGIRPGSIVEYDPQPGSSPPVPLPNSDLFGDSCLVPGARLANQRASQANPPGISIPNFTYDVDETLHEGADISVPQFYNMAFKAGPHWNDVSKVELSTEKSWLATLDEIAAVSAYKSCQIRKSCADYIRAARYRIVGTTIVTKGMAYKIYDKHGDLVSLSGGLSSGKFKMTVGAGSSTNTVSDATVQSVDPRVLGVRLLPPSVFSGQQSCEDSIVFTPSATVSGTIFGGGGKSTIGQLTEQKGLSERISLQKEGTEASECDAGFERKISKAAVEARVTAPSSGILDFSYALAARGGHYATAAQCLGNLLIGRTGHDTTATALAEMNAKNIIIVRADAPPPMRIDFARLPPNSRLRIVDWQGRPLQIARTVLQRGDTTTVYEDIPATVSGSGSYTVQTHGPGVYLLEATVRLSSSVSGDADMAQTDTATVRVSMQNP